MDRDALLRTIAVGAAVAILAAPYRRLVVDALKAGIAAAQAHAYTLGRFAAAGLILAAAWGKVPMPDFYPVVPAVSIDVPEPSPELRTAVEPVQKALATLSPADRALWAATWAKAAIVVEADGTSSVEAFRDTAALRLFTTVALDIAWRRLGRRGGRHAVSARPRRRARYAADAGLVRQRGTSDCVGRLEVSDG